MQTVTAIYPGSFDPMTYGHLDIVTRASHLFQHVLVGIAHNTSKAPFMALSDRLAMATDCVAHLPNVVVKTLEGLTVHFAQAHDARVIIRGLRAVSDFEFEFMMSQMNHRLAPQLDTMFMMAGLEFQFLSSSMVKEVASLGGSVEGLVPPVVQRYLEARFTHV
jgi:pantetheine-phosphate adenylyltransferase